MTDQVNTAPTHQGENLGLVLILLIGGGVLIGALFLLITYQYRLVYFSALVPSLAAFALMCYTIWQGRIRGRLFSLILGLIFGLLIYGSYQAMRYVAFRRISVTGYLARPGNRLTPTEADQMLDQQLVLQTGVDGFLGYVRYELKSGMVIGSTNPLMGSSNQVTGDSVLFYWFYDAAIIVGGALTGAWWANDRAFCDHCHKYYGRIRSSGGDMGMQKIGWLDKNAADQFKRLLEVGHFEQAGTLLQNKKTGMEIKIERCDTCNTTPVILSAYGGGSFTSSQRTMRFRHALSADDYDKLTAFAALEPQKRNLSSANEWMLGISVVVLFLAGLMWAFGALQSSSKF